MQSWFVLETRPKYDWFGSGAFLKTNLMISLSSFCIGRIDIRKIYIFCESLIYRIVTFLKPNVETFSAILPGGKCTILFYHWQNFFISAEECYKSPLEWRIWVECNGNCLVVSFWVGLWSTSLYGKASMPLERFELLTVWKNEKFTLTCEIFREMSVKCNLV